MCGIAGYIGAPEAERELERRVTRMSDALFTRGPDSSGCWVHGDSGIALAHRRLAIVDLSPMGHQPMLSRCGRYVMIYNGEVYNAEDIRPDLLKSGHTFRGHSDTEVMLEAIAEWGVETATRLFNGIYAFAVWDRSERALFLVRDRLGVKPLYYGWNNGHFLFGSELKALRAHERAHFEIEREALPSFLRHNYIPAPKSVYRRIYKLWPGSILKIGAGTLAEPADFSPLPDRSPSGPRTYWTAREVFERGEREPFTGSFDDAVRATDELLRDAVKRQMMADVPLGAFLSGGVDSSTVAALMQAQSSAPVKTFTIGMDVDKYNEATFARDVAAHLKTEHTEWTISPAEARAVIPRLPEMFDEPFSDSSQIPTFLVSQMTRSKVTVSLSGDGGDELFSGYNRYFLGRRIWKRVGWMPRRSRLALAEFCRSSLWGDIEPLLGGVLSRLVPELRGRSLSQSLQKVADVVGAAEADDFYLFLTSHWKNPAAVVRGLPEAFREPLQLSRHARLGDFTRRMMLTDITTYLPDDILVKVDRASMAVSLEARVPILDHRVVEFAATLPLEQHLRGGEGKAVLKEVLYKYVPKALLDRPKMGFGIPLCEWLRGDLRDWAEALLGETRLKQDGFFAHEPIRQLWHEHQSGGYDWSYYLWDILMFNAWLDAQK